MAAPNKSTIWNHNDLLTTQLTNPPFPKTTANPPTSKPQPTKKNNDGAIPPTCVCACVRAGLVVTYSKCMHYVLDTHSRMS